MEQIKTKNAKPLLMMMALLLAYFITGLLLLLLAFLLYRFGISESQVNLGILGVYIVSCLAGGFYIGKKAGARRLFWGAGLGIGYAVLLEAVTVLTERQGGRDPKEIGLMVLICFLGGALGGSLS